MRPQTRALIDSQDKMCRICERAIVQIATSLLVLKWPDRAVDGDPPRRCNPANGGHSLYDRKPLTEPLWRHDLM